MGSSACRFLCHSCVQYHLAAGTSSYSQHLLRGRSSPERGDASKRPVEGPGSSTTLGHKTGLSGISPSHWKLTCTRFPGPGTKPSQNVQNAPHASLGYQSEQAFSRQDVKTKGLTGMKFPLAMVRYVAPGYCARCAPYNPSKGYQHQAILWHDIVKRLNLCRCLRTH